MPGWRFSPVRCIKPAAEGTIGRPLHFALRAAREVSRMPGRAIWKGSIRIAELVCPVALYSAASTSERIALHTLNRPTGHRVHRQYVDEKTDKPVPAEEQVKGYETTDGKYVVLEPEEVAAAVPHGDKALSIDTFIACSDIDDTYFDKPYYLLPGDRVAEESFVLIREGLRSRKVAAIAHAVLFRRLRAVLIRPHRQGLIATTLNFDYEVRSAADAFADVPKRKIEGEMLDLAKHIIKGKAGKFDPAGFEDRYEAALAELVKAKIEGRKIVALPRPAPTKPDNLLEALRLSAGGKAKPAPARRRAGERAKPVQRKAG
jgi:DNA end-binding protein Ku